jgi:hypothetical protein
MQEIVGEIEGILATIKRPKLEARLLILSFELLDQLLREFRSFPWIDDCGVTRRPRADLRQLNAIDDRQESAENLRTADYRARLAFEHFDRVFSAVCDLSPIGFPARIASQYDVPSSGEQAG